MAETVVDVTSSIEGTVTSVLLGPGDDVVAGGAIVVVELMKLEQQVTAPQDGSVVDLFVVAGDEITVGMVVATLEPDGRREVQHDASNPLVKAQTSTESGASDTDGHDDGSVRTERPDLDALRARVRLTTDEARPGVVADRHGTGSRTARANVADLVDEGSFVEYGALAHAAQRRRRDADELRRRTPADGIVTGLGAVEGRAIALAAYDYTVLAGTQGHTSHAKLDRILGVASELRLPFILYAEGGGGRPGDTDVLQGAWLGVPTFRLLAQLSALAPTIAVCHGYAFAGNAALAGVCDVVVATEGAVIGMAGPAMVAGGGLGDVAPAELGPVATHRSTGAVDVVAADEQEATSVARALVGLLAGGTRPHQDDGAHEQDVGERMRHLVPLDRKRAHDAGALLELVADVGSLVELRGDAAPGMRTALARVGGRAVGLVANDPRHLAGAIDSDGAESAADLLDLCDARGLPVVSLVDTPGFMVGPSSDAEGAYRRTGRMFRAGARLTTPLVAVIVRRAFGLGAMAMTGGDLRAPLATFTWPSAELGPMGLEGAVRLGNRRELDAIDDPDAREERVADLLAAMREDASALQVATFADVDDVIDPADTRARIRAVLDAATRG